MKKYCLCLALVLALGTIIASAQARIAPSLSDVAKMKKLTNNHLLQIKSAKKYFVVLGSFKSKADAIKRNDFFGDAFIARSEKYPKFKNGYWVVLMGPYTKSEAMYHRDGAHEAVPSAYVKAGW